MAQTDEELLAQTKSGDGTAFEVLVDRYMRKAYFIAYDIVGNQEDARDLSQEAFVKAYESLARFRGESSFYTWFYRILVNCCFDFRKRRIRIDAVTVEPLTDPDTGREVERPIQATGRESNPLEALRQTELGEKIREAVATLTPQQRTAFILKNDQGLRIKEIAKVMRVAEGTVKAHLHWAAKSLQVKLKAYR
jgi:RNA polymerase sigma-70 factor (ECF subfamily)